MRRIQDLLAIAASVSLAVTHYAPSAMAAAGFVSGYFVGGTTDSSGNVTFGKVQQYFAGTGTYVNLVRGSNRWGDYSATTLDPMESNKFWTIQEYASSSPSAPNTWSTQFAGISFNTDNTITFKSFAGSSQLGCGICIFPPDTMGAAGSSHFVQMGNGDGPGFAVYNKSDGKPAPGFPETLATFWNNAGVTAATNSTGDSRILYDPGSGHWFATTLANPIPSPWWTLPIATCPKPCCRHRRDP